MADRHSYEPAEEQQPLGRDADAYEPSRDADAAEAPGPLQVPATSAATAGPADRSVSSQVADLPHSRAQAWDRLYDAALDEMTALLQEQARAWAARLELLQRMDDLSSLGAQAGVAQFTQLEMAGSWNVSQITATRWQAEAARFGEALPRTFAMLRSGDLLEHQAKVLLHRTAHCTAEVARAVEAVVLPDGARLCPADLGKVVDRTVLRVESEQADAAAAEHRRAQAVAQRRTFAKPLPDGMALAGAVLTAEQMVGWQAGMERLERRERIADREAGVERTAEQRRADLFAALPSMVLAGTAQDRAAVLAGTAQDRAAVLAGTAQDRAAGPARSGPVTRSPGETPAPYADGPARSGVVPCPRPADLRPWTLGPEQIAAQVVLNVHVPVSTVLDVSRAPGSLDRYGPVSAEHVRLLRPHSWRRVMVDSTSGQPIALDDRPTPADPDPVRAREQVLEMLRPDVVVDADEPQHDPSARLARLVDVRDVRCCGPGCSSSHTHRDHLEPHPVGATSASNLGRLSPRCHRAKHAGWTLERHRGGSVTWTSPLGRVYDRPSPHAPPPRVDLHAEQPALRPRPALDRPDRSTDAGGAAAGSSAPAASRHGHRPARTAADASTASAADPRPAAADPRPADAALPPPDDDPPPF